MAVVDVLRMPLGDGGELLLRLDAPVAGGEPKESHGPVQAGRGVSERMAERVVAAEETLEKALEPIANASRSVLRVLGQVGPEEIEVEFGVEFTAEASAVMARMGGNCHLNVRLTWKREEVAPASGSPAASGATATVP